MQDGATPHTAYSTRAFLNTHFRNVNDSSFPIEISLNLVIFDNYLLSLRFYLGTYTELAINLCLRTTFITVKYCQSAKKSCRRRRVDVFMKMARKWHESQKIARKWHETAIGHFIVPKQLVIMSDW